MPRVPGLFGAYFPRFRVRAAPGRIAAGTMRSTRVVRWGAEYADRAAREVLGSEWRSPRELPDLYRKAALADPLAFNERLNRVYAPLWQELDRSVASMSADDARRIVVSSDASPDSGGHISLVLSREPPASSMPTAANYRLLRAVLACFPGYFAQLDPATVSRYAQALRTGGVGAAAATLKGVWSPLADFNAERFLNREPLKDMAAIGMSSLISMEAHTVRQLGDGWMHSIANSTGPQHSFDGLAGLSLFERPSGRYWASMHVGEAWAPGADPANVDTAPHAFKLALARGLTVLDRYDDYVRRVGEREAAKIFLSYALWWEFQKDAMRDGRLDQTFDAAMLATIDELGGNLYSWARRYHPNTSVVVDPSAYAQMEVAQVVREIDRQASVNGEMPTSALPPDATAVPFDPTREGAADPVDPFDPTRDPARDPTRDPVDPFDPMREPARDPARGPEGPPVFEPMPSGAERGEPGRR